MDSLDLAKSFYETARAELIERIRLRDNVLLLYLGAIGTIYGIAFGTAVSTSILLAAPLIALGAAILISQHNAVIGSLASYCAGELQAFFDKLIINECPTQWENSASLHENYKRSTSLRSWGHFILILAPPLAALAINWKFAVFSHFSEAMMWWFGALCAGISVWVIRTTHSWRAGLYERRKWIDAKILNRKSPQRKQAKVTRLKT